LAHARRNFYDIHVTRFSPATTEALRSIGARYAIEEQVRGKPPDLRLGVRQAQAKPMLDDIRQRIGKMLRSFAAKSDTAGGIPYALSHWGALRR
jgi:transposase